MRCAKMYVLFFLFIFDSVRAAHASTNTTSKRKAVSRMRADRKPFKGTIHSAIDLDDTSSEGEDDVSGGAKAESSSRITPFGVVTTTSIGALLGDRAQMERERLERQRKRQREAGIENDDDDNNNGKQEEEKGPSLEKRAKKVSSSAEEKVPMYWNGTIKKSFNVYSTDAPGTRFEEFIRPTTAFRANGLTHAVMATYCEDIPWLASMFPKSTTGTPPEITMITLASGELRPGVYAPLHRDLPNWIRLVVPRKGLTEWTTMHMKFLLLFYDDRLRFILLSGNLVDYDWSRIENTAFIHDFPKRKGERQDDESSSSSSSSSSSYDVQLRRILSSLSVPQGHFAMQQLSAYDLNSTCEAQLVVSIPTTKPLVGWNAIEEVGLGRLAKVVRDTVRSTSASAADLTPFTLEAQGSSMGNYSPRWLQQMHIVCSALDYKRLLPLPTGVKANAVWAKATGCRESDKWPPIRLLFPSDRWVKTQSIEGAPGAGTFFGKSKAAVEKGFVELLYQPESLRANVMMHHKAILAVGRGAEEKESNDIVGWAYMGSHNLTQAAWGNISMPKQGAEPQMSINNWELGIVVPVRRSDIAHVHHSTATSEFMAANIITWKRPVERYRSDDIPWDQFAQ